MATHNEARPGGIDACDLLEGWYDLNALDQDMIVFEVWRTMNKGKMLAITIGLGMIVAVLIYSTASVLRTNPVLAFWLGFSAGALAVLLIVLARKLR